MNRLGAEIGLRCVMKSPLFPSRKYAHLLELLASDVSPGTSESGVTV
jgi:hypothetical protein